MVSIERARDVYGVALARDGVLNEEETALLRKDAKVAIRPSVR
jgi:hypothetical protein